MKKVCVILVMVLVLSAVVAGCREEQPRLDWGEYRDGVYQNRFFDYTIHIDPSYDILSPREILMMNAEEDQQDIDISTLDNLEQEPILHYLHAFKYPRSSDVKTNASISIYSENLRFLSGVSTKEAYITAKMTFIQGVFRGTPHILEMDRPQNLWIHGREFAKGRVVMDVEGIAVTQEFYVIIRRGYALVTLISFTTQEEGEELRGFVQSIRMGS